MTRLAAVRRRAAVPAKFAIVGITNTLIDYVVFLMLVYILKINVLPANVVSYSCGIINSFIMNRQWTFSATRHTGPVARQFAAFLMCNLAGLGIASFILWLLAAPLGPALAKLVAVGGTVTWNYTLSRYLVFAAR